MAESITWNPLLQEIALPHKKAILSPIGRLARRDDVPLRPLLGAVFLGINLAMIRIRTLKPIFSEWQSIFFGE